MTEEQLERRRLKIRTELVSREAARAVMRHETPEVIGRVRDGFIEDWARLQEMERAARRRVRDTAKVYGS